MIVTGLCVPVRPRNKTPTSQMQRPVLSGREEKKTEPKNKRIRTSIERNVSGAFTLSTKKATKDKDNPGNQDNHSSKRITVRKKSTVTLRNTAKMDTKGILIALKKNYNNQGNVTKIAIKVSTTSRGVRLGPKLECLHTFQQTSPVSTFMQIGSV